MHRAQTHFPMIREQLLHSGSKFKHFQEQLFNAFASYLHHQFFSGCDGHSTWYLTPSPGHTLLPISHESLCQQLRPSWVPWPLDFPSQLHQSPKWHSKQGLHLALQGLHLAAHLATGDWTVHASSSRAKAWTWGHPSLFAQRGLPFLMISVGYSPEGKPHESPRYGSGVTCEEYLWPEKNPEIFLKSKSLSIPNLPGKDEYSFLRTIVYIFSLFYNDHILLLFYNLHVHIFTIHLCLPY